ncbi:hypothetical protein QFC19_007369 [Naganishia cerealis]|uniref:Uncharacterized protein n=1 Tax=Naganishia cerealis TaxID=610337 RepID=A0ACC2VAE2_9TREE|nr:hypothetical protein QFC19_007369 [Naganishia cerealis]
MGEQNKFHLGSEAEAATQKSIRALVAHSRKAGKSEPIYLIINTVKPMVRKKDYTPRIIPVTNKIGKLQDKSVLLVTKDPSTPYRHALTEKDSATEDVFNQIYTLTKLKSLAKDPKKLSLMFKEYDLVVADNRIHKFLPDILGAQFFLKNKKIPFMVQMARPSPESQAQLTKSKLSTKLKDNRCEPKYVYSQMKAIARNTYFIPSAKGTCVSIVIGHTEMETPAIVTNLNDVIGYLVDLKNLPVGGLLRTIENIVSVHVKTSESVSMEIKKEKGIEEKN